MVTIKNCDGTKMRVMVLHNNDPYCPGAASGGDPPPGWNPNPSPKPAGPSGEEELAAVVETGLKMISFCFWGFLLFLWKFFEYLPQEIEASRKK
jgi:hypothetical protein